MTDDEFRTRRLSYWSQDNNSFRSRKLSLYSSRPAEMSVQRRLLYFGMMVAAISYCYSLMKSNKTKDTFTVQMAVMDAWNKQIQRPSVRFEKVIVGINSNVDLIVSGIHLLGQLDIDPSIARDHEVIQDRIEFQQAFSHSFTHGVPNERYTRDRALFYQGVDAAEKLKGAELSVGGNAALIAQKIASSFHSAKVTLVGPIGPRLKALLHPRIITHNSTKISKDEIHLIMEYKQGEIFGDHVAPMSSRFITSHDTLSTSAIVMDMFFNSVRNEKPDLIVLSGLHLLETQPKQLWAEKLKTTKQNLKQLSFSVPIHLEMASMANEDYAVEFLNKILPYVDSIGINEMELVFFSQVGGGPFSDVTPSSGGIHVHKVSAMLHWMINKFGRDPTSQDPVKRSSYRLQRIHFYSLTYQMIVTVGPEWSNSAAAVAAGAQIASSVACQKHSRELSSEDVDLRLPETFLLDKSMNKMYQFSPGHPITSWMRDQVLFIFTPSLVCKSPKKTVGIGDHISATGLMYSQFYRYQPTVTPS